MEIICRRYDCQCSCQSQAKNGAIGMPATPTSLQCRLVDTGGIDLRTLSIPETAPTIQYDIVSNAIRDHNPRVKAPKWPAANEEAVPSAASPTAR